MVLHNGSLIIHGGNLSVSASPPEETIIFSIDKLRLTDSGRIYNSQLVGHLYNHVAVCVKNYMLVQGGVEYFSDVMQRDCFVLNLSTLAWERLIHTGDFEIVSSHSACVAISKDKLQSKAFEFYRINQAVNTNVLGWSKIKHEGIYFFGGVDDQGFANSLVRVLKIFKQPTELTTLDVKGVPPYPRLESSMDFYAELNIVIVYAGRDTAGRALRDFWVLDLEKVQWLRVAETREQGDLGLSRSGHVSAMNGRSMFIFGGSNENSYESSDFVFVDLDFLNYNRAFRAATIDTVRGNVKKKKRGVKAA